MIQTNDMNLYISVLKVFAGILIEAALYNFYATSVVIETSLHKA